ncbi:antitoxin YezG family protein [Metabacillus fastidiosus]|uniref:antitoxin YezG family protein n=1 Tax=Metabacillus fastidiosus TaxID=1458 RepID=UPI002DB645CD|nr:antitoxin YezG family protein [Metabacillus fastidiosus]MEC2074524.1 antitoxin YezG family protein [Metabacillus fastidiosus]
MNENKLNSIYQNIAQTVIETIPEEWSKVFVYGEITEDTSNAFFFYYPENNKSPIHSHNIPDIFGIEKETYKEKWRTLLDYLEELWYEFKNNNQEPWTNLTFIFNHEGELKIDYDYEDLSEANDYERRIIWKYKYLKLLPEDKDDQEILKTYLCNHNLLPSDLK